VGAAFSRNINVSAADEFRGTPQMEDPGRRHCNVKEGQLSLDGERRTTCSQKAEIAQEQSQGYILD
jgi:hypothetical protein